MLPFLEARIETGWSRDRAILIAQTVYIAYAHDQPYEPWNAYCNCYKRANGTANPVMIYCMSVAFRL